MGDHSGRTSPTDVERDRGRLVNLLLTVPEFADAWVENAWVENRGRRGVVVFARRALFEQLSDHWRGLPLLGQAEQSLGVRLAVGFGAGPSARTSVQLAERAAARAQSENHPCGYLIEDGGLVVGPIGTGARPGTPAASEPGIRMRELARTAGLSPATLSRLAAVERDLAGRTVTPSELANALAITDPSGRRLLRKLHDHGLVTSEGSAHTRRKGRPTQLYRLAIEAALTAPTDERSLASA